MQSKSKARHRWRTAIMLTTLGLIGGTLLMPSVSPATHVIRAAQDVFVANDDAHPVPTKSIGTAGVRVENGDDRPVPVTGAVDANIQGTPTVRVEGPRAEPLSRPFSMLFVGNRSSEDDAYTVPDGKRLLVEFVTFHDSGESSRMQRFSAKVGNVEHHLTPIAASDRADLVSQAVKIVVDAGETLRFRTAFSEPIGFMDPEGYSSGQVVVLNGSWTGTLTDVDTSAG